VPHIPVHRAATFIGGKSHSYPHEAWPEGVRWWTNFLGPVDDFLMELNDGNGAEFTAEHSLEVSLIKIVSVATSNEQWMKRHFEVAPPMRFGQQLRVQAVRTSLRPNRNQIIVALIERIGTRDNFRLLPIESRFIGQRLHGRLREGWDVVARNPLAAALNS
jgi:hypothetical protein